CVTRSKFPLRAARSRRCAVLRTQSPKRRIPTRPPARRLRFRRPTAT
ncbi:MAG: hypothetical protein AVDCRST_MAG64-1037, partial [uncultured Phycisphaerae bacterium]